MPLRTALLALAVLAPLTQASATDAATGPRRTTALVVFVPAGGAALGAGLSTGVMSGTQGACAPAQLALDASAGSRVGCVEYDRPLPSLVLLASAGGGRVSGWADAVARARAAPQLLVPGLLAQLTGGAAYAGPSGGPNLGALLAADRSGLIAALALAPPGHVASAARSLLADHRLVVADLPESPAGSAELGTLLRQRRAGELVVAIQRPLDGADGELIWTGAAGLTGGAGHALTSATTEQTGMIAAIDLAPTILAHLGISEPAAMLGRPIVETGTFSHPALLALERRLRAIPGRRPAALAALLAAWGALVVAAAAAAGARGRAWALRVGALAVLWLPAASLVPAALDASAGLEYALLVSLCLVLAAASDGLLAWPRAPLAPLVVALVAITLDALAGTGLLLRALPGPDPLGGARFHGIGNELKSALAVMSLTAVAASLHPSRRARPALAAIAGAGVVLATIEGSARVGAGVGGAILVTVAFAVACATVVPGGLRSRRLAAIALAPVVALGALAALDLLTAGGTGHFSASVLHARSGSDLWDIVVRRYSGAWRELANGAMASATAIALVGCVLVAARPERLLGPLASDRAWSAAVRGAVAAGVCGSLVEDSGPLLLVVAAFTLACVGAYARGRPGLTRRAVVTRPAVVPAVFEAREGIA